MFSIASFAKQDISKRIQILMTAPEQFPLPGALLRDSDKVAALSLWRRHTEEECSELRLIMLMCYVVPVVSAVIYVKCCVLKINLKKHWGYVVPYVVPV